MDAAIEYFKREPVLTVKTAARNLWNLYSLDHRSEDGLKLFTQVLLNARSEEFNELDIANALRAYAHF